MFPALAAILFGAALFAQAGPAPADPKFSAGVEVVNVFVTVRDKKGAIVKDLARDDFTLSEEGRPQTIRYFTRESDLPLTVGLIVDTTPSESNMLEAERSASRAFLNKTLRPEKDKAFLIQFAEEVELIQDVTSSREKLDAALDQLESHQRAGPGRAGGRGSSSTILADAISLAADEVMKPQPGRKALIILADGDHIGSRAEAAIAAAQRADTVVYAIRIWDKSFGGGGGGGGGAWRTLGRIPGLGVPGAGGPGMGGPGRGPGGPGGPGGGGPPGSRDAKEMKEIAERTGGACFETSRKLSLEEIYGRIEEELRSQYSLGYTPEGDARAGYRKIKVAVAKKGMAVQARDGYYSSAR